MARDLSAVERRQALAALLREKAAAREARRVPLSFAQQRVWFAQQLRPETPFFNLTNAVRLVGRLDVPALGRSLAEIVRRHQVLRSVFETAAGEPVQRLAPTSPTPPPPSMPAAFLPEIDLTALGSEGRDAEVRRVAGDEAGRPFDLGSGLLLRSALLRLASAERVLLLNVHHIACDGGSLEVLTAELAALYGAFSAGEPSPLPEPALQYADFALWQRARLQGETLESHIDYWRRRLRGISDLVVPTDFPRPRERTFAGASRAFALPAGPAALRALCRREGVTLAMATLAAFQVVLGRHAGEEDIAVGSPIAGREREDLSGLIGFFSNTVVLRTDLSGGPGFRALLARVREGSLEATAHQDLSFDRLVEELRPERDPGRHPLVQVMFSFRHQPQETLELPDLRLETFEFETGSARFDLELIVWEAGEAGLGGQVLYNTDLFHGSTAARLGLHFVHLLAAAPATPERPVFDLPLLSVAEHHQIVREWNDTACRDLAGRSVLERIAAAARRSPEVTAVVCDGERLTFGELVAGANRLARHLRAAGAGPEVRVGLCLERSVRLPLAVLAVLAAGAAFVPLDPRYPRGRLEQTVADAAPALLLTESGRAPEWLAGVSRARVIEIDRLEPAIHALSPAALEEPAAAGDLAYLVYTSGTTGAPKGVAISHGNLAEYLPSLGAGLGITAADVYLHTASFGFSSSVRQLLLPLAHGARLALATADEVADPLALCRRAAGERVTVMDLVPSYAQSLLGVVDRLPEEARAGLLGRHLRLVLTASEPLLSGLPGRWARAFGGRARFLNLLGHSEATGIGAVHAVTEEETSPVVPLGRPLPGRRVYLLDLLERGDRPVPLGAAGEIAIGGTGIGRGYWNRPELTAAAFTPDPWGGLGERLYRTGDLGRFLPDGTLAFLGRRDQQVKVRGQRIEIAEIEAWLERSPGVAQAAVVARQSSRGETELVAYVVGKEGRRGSPGEIRRHLGERLPQAMLPKAFVFVEALPRTPTGKLDRGALPDPPRREESPAAAGTETRLAALVATVWCEVLDLPRVGLEDDLFELGGHSLLAVLLTARLREELGVEVSLRALFSEPTVARTVREVTDRLIAVADRDERAAAVREVAGLSDAEVVSRLQRGGSGRARDSR